MGLYDPIELKRSHNLKNKISNLENVVDPKWSTADPKAVQAAHDDNVL
tara:strand:+ start:132 stop:275 length:144 start_codon:yes stop_codon:yes gene_type:complete